MKTAIAMGLVMLAACGSGGGSAQEWTVPCTNDVASHDFGTTDLGVLARVVAYEDIATAKDGSFDGGTVEQQVETRIVGSVVEATCTNGFASFPVTFVLEP